MKPVAPLVFKLILKYFDRFKSNALRDNTFYNFIT